VRKIDTVEELDQCDHITTSLTTAAIEAKRSRRFRQRRKSGVRVFTVELSDLDFQALAKAAPQADPTVERTIQAVLRAAAPRHARRKTDSQGHGATEQSSQMPGDRDVCAYCGAAGIVGYFAGALLPAEIGGERFMVHSRCFEALAAARRAHGGA
jgi:hypothetical protein